MNNGENDNMDQLLLAIKEINNSLIGLNDTLKKIYRTMVDGKENDRSDKVNNEVRFTE